MKDKMVSQPSHYADGEIECIDAMVAAFGSEKVKAYAELAAFKYQWRMDKKHEDSKQDKQKAIWYLRYSMGDDPRLEVLPERFEKESVEYSVNKGSLEYRIKKAKQAFGQTAQDSFPEVLT
tara:strand:+ start:249 stop:611 length:363 start_codon:yes stop_codon:yes gene_type:complete